MRESPISQETVMSMRTSRLALLALASLAGQAAGQSFNIDIGQSGSAPASSFGGSALQPGTWNNITSSSAASVALTGLNGVATSVQFLRDPSTTFATNTSAGVTGAYESLLEDVQTNGSSALVYKITGLQPGAYLFYTYATDVNASDDNYGVSVNNALGQASQNCGGGTVNSNTFRTGLTHTIHYRIVNIGDTVQINVGGVFGITAQCAGIQAVYLGNNGSQARFFVDDSAVGDHAGRSWASAMTDLQDALDATARIGGNAEIWVASGTYKPTSGTDRNASFVIPNGARVYGGFAGAEAALADRPDPIFPSVLSGAIGGAADTDNSYTVVDASNTNGSTIFDGFAVTKGYNTSGNGGGMVADGAYLTVRNSHFFNNFAANGGALAANGGYPKIYRNLFNNNTVSGMGGAVRLENALANTARIANCEFLKNSAGSGGGAISTSSLSLQVSNSLFNGNSVAPGSGGAVVATGNVNNNCTAFFSNCTFTSNTAGSNAGAVYGQTKMVVVFWNSILWNNTASAGTTFDKQASVKSGDLSSLSWTRTSIQGGSGATGWDPRFIDLNGADNVAGTLDDNLHLAAGSPAFDAGSNELVALDVYDLDGDNDVAEYAPLDLDGNPRNADIPGIDDTPGETAPTVDRGCYERSMPTCIADLNGDTVVDLVDFFQFFNDFDQSQTGADLDLSGEVDLSDFFMFLNAFDAGC
jgi:predicted outer membrane repeat protein